MMEMQRITLYCEGFSPIVIRKVTMVDESYFYESLSYSHPHYLHERWTKIALSNEQVESQIEKYAQQSVQRTGGESGSQSSLFTDESSSSKVTRQSTRR